MDSKQLISRGELPDWTGAVFDGSGDGSGYGSGSGYGYGYGDGDGYGYGDGDGYGYGVHWPSIYLSQRTGWPDSAKQRLLTAEQEASAIAFWRSDAKGLPANGGKSKTPATVGLVETLDGKLSTCSKGFHATMKPDEWQGERIWVVALYGECVWEGDKCAAMKREILGEIIL